MQTIKLSLSPGRAQARWFTVLWFNSCCGKHLTATVTATRGILQKPAHHVLITDHVSLTGTDEEMRAAIVSVTICQCGYTRKQTTAYHSDTPWCCAKSGPPPVNHQLIEAQACCCIFFLFLFPLLLQKHLHTHQRIRSQGPRFADAACHRRSLSPEVSLTTWGTQTNQIP